MRLRVGVKIVLVALVGVAVSVVSKFLNTPYDHLVSAAGHAILVVFWILILVQYRDQRQAQKELEDE